MRPIDNPVYAPDVEIDDERAALDTFPVILLAAGYKGVGLRTDSPTMRELGRLSCCIIVPRTAMGRPAELGNMRGVLGYDGQLAKTSVLGTPAGVLSGEVLYCTAGPADGAATCRSGRGSRPLARGTSRPTERLIAMENRVRFARMRRHARGLIDTGTAHCTGA